MEPKRTKLYKVTGKGLANSVYAAADRQQDAVEMVSDVYDTVDKFTLSVQYVDEVVYYAADV